jgi:dipeptidyl-peptidase-4
VVLVGSGPDLTTSDLYRLRFNSELERLSEPDGWSVGTARGGTTVVVRADLGAPRSHASVRGPGSSWPVPSHAEAPELAIRPEFLADDTGWQRIAVLWPSTAAVEPLPIIMSPYGGPHAQRSVRAAGAFATEQWLADQGFCVVVADGPGAPSRPSNEHAIFRDLGHQPLEGQVTALLAVLQHYGERLDRDRVAIRGWSFGGYLAAFAVMERPDLFTAGIAGAPVTDWTRYDTHYTERYLGTPESEPAAHAHATLLNKAHRLHRPLLLIHGMADDNVYATHTLQLSRELLAAGKPHTVLPLSGETHLTRQLAISENQLRLELAFLRDALNLPGPAAVDVPLPGAD